jgi:integrase
MVDNANVSSVKYPFVQEMKQGKWLSRRSGKRYERFGETVRFLTPAELQLFFEVVARYEHKLVFRLAYEMGCRVGELVRIQVKHLDFLNASVFIPAENTKTRQKRTSFVSQGLMNEVEDWLRRQNLLRRENGVLRHGEVYLFRSRTHPRGHITENRVRQIFKSYVRRAELEREYGKDSRGRPLHQLTVHSLRHTHCIHYIHIYKVPVPIVQRQVGHRTLQATMIYCRPTLDMVKEAYGNVSATAGAGLPK